MAQGIIGKPGTGSKPVRVTNYKPRIGDDNAFSGNFVSLHITHLI